MGRGIRYRRGPSVEQIAVASRAQEDALYRRGLTFITVTVIMSLLLTEGVWYFASDKVEWYTLLCLPPLISLATISGLFRLIRWMRLFGL